MLVESQSSSGASAPKLDNPRKISCANSYAPTLSRGMSGKTNRGDAASPEFVVVLRLVQKAIVLLSPARCGRCDQLSLELQDSDSALMPNHQSSFEVPYLPLD